MEQTTTALCRVLPIFDPQTNSALTFRPLGASDAAEIARLFEGLSEQDRYYRFLRATPKYTPAMMRLLTGMDGDRHVAIGAFTGNQLVGIGRYVVLASEPTTAELAVTVCPSQRRCGIAQKLLDHLDVAAAHAGLIDFEAYVCPQNRGAIRLFADRGFKFRFEDGASYGVRSVPRVREPIAA